ncbi:hypothetical protein [Comamonas sp. 4034]|uniref:hypothetical protein n=1 Tax=Comamonas sp. 4034 TaxID=3156455 RepID=UPI003D19FF7D
MFKYLDLVIIFAFVVMVYFLGAKMGRKYAIKIDNDKIIIERSLVTQVINLSDIKKINVKKGGVVFYGDFLVMGKNKKNWHISNIEILNNERDDVEKIVKFLGEKGFLSKSGFVA